MAQFKYDTQEEKLRLQARAVSLKPNVVGVVATESGWEIPQPKGTMEILVSFKGLDDLLGDNTPEFINKEPLDVNVPAVKEDTEEVAEITEETKPVKKSGRPKKVADEDSQ